METLAREERRKKEEDRADLTTTFERIGMFARAARKNGVRLVLASMPGREPYRLQPELLSALPALGVDLLDCRHVPSLSKSHFSDRVHMNHQGAELFSRAYGQRLSALLGTGGDSR